MAAGNDSLAAGDAGPVSDNDDLERPVWPPVDAPTYEGPGSYGGYRTWGDQPICGPHPYRPYQPVRTPPLAPLDIPPPQAMVLSRPPLTDHQVRANRLAFVIGAAVVAVLWLVAGLTFGVIAAFAWVGMAIVIAVQLGRRVGQVLGLSSRR